MQLIYLTTPPPQPSNKAHQHPWEISPTLATQTRDHNQAYSKTTLPTSTPSRDLLTQT